MERHHLLQSLRNMHQLNASNSLGRLSSFWVTIALAAGAAKAHVSHGEIHESSQPNFGMISRREFA